MKTIRSFTIVASVFLLPLDGAVRAAVYTKASVTQVYKDVKLLEPTGVRPARVNDSIAGQQSVKTGIQSRAELVFDDQSMTRLGANTIFSFQQGTRELELKQGTILFEVPKRAGGASIRTAAVTAAITGTTGFYEFSPKAGKNGIIKFGILEGGATLSIRGRIGQTIHIGPGEMIIVSANPKNFDATDVVHFDISDFIKTCNLITRMGGLRPVGDRLVRREISEQHRLVNRTGELIPTDLYFPGGGTQLFIDSQVDRRFTQSGSPGLGSGTTGGPTTNAPPPVTQVGSQIVLPNPYLVTQSTQIVTDPTITTSGVTNTGRIYRDATQDGKLGVFIYGSTDPFDRLAVQNPGAVKDLSIFEFSNLQITGSPQVTTAGNFRNLALLSDGTITTGAPGGTFDLDVLDQLALLTKSGKIVIGPEFNFSSSLTAAQVAGNSLTFILYARGSSSDLIFGSDVNFTERHLELSAGHNIEVTGHITTSSSVDPSTSLVSNVNISAGNDFLLGPSAGIDSQIVQIFAHDVSGSSGSLVRADRLAVTVSNPVTLTDSGGFYFVNSLPVSQSSAFLSISGLAGLTVPGNFTFEPDTTGSFLSLSSGGNVTVNGTLQTDTRTTIVAGGNFVLGPSGAILSPEFAVSAKDVAGSGTATIRGNNISVQTQNSLTVSQAGNFITLNTLPIDLTTSAFADLSISSATGVRFPSNVNLSTSGGSPSLVVTSGKDISMDGALTSRGGSVGMFATGNFSMSSVSPGIIVDGIDAGVSGPGGSGGVVQINATGNIDVDGLSNPAGGIYAVTGANAPGVSSGGAGGNVSLFSQQGSISVRKPIVVSYSDTPGSGGRTSASGGSIVLNTAKSSGLAINVTNTGALRSLLDAAAPGPGGSIRLQSAGGDIRVAGAIQADRGAILIQNNGLAGVIAMNAGHDVRADTVKVGALGNNGVLNIGGGVIDAVSEIKLFAGGSNGTINFVSSTTISGTAAKSIAAKTVNVNIGVRLQIDGGTVTFFTDVPHYNGAGINAGSGFGTVVGSAPASTVPHAGRPSFP